MKSINVKSPSFLASFQSLIVFLIVTFLAQAFVIPHIEPYFTSLIIFVGINIITAVALNIVLGFTGQFSIGHAGFMAVGAYSSALISITIKNQYPELLSSPLTSNLLFFVSILGGSILAALSGYIVGLPSLRLKGDYLAIVTLGFGEIIRVLFLNVPAVGGAQGLIGIPALTSVAWVYSIAGVITFITWRLIRSPKGRSFLSVREDEIAAEAMGVHTTNTKVTAFVISAFMTGAAGALFAHTLQYINPGIFNFMRSFEIIIMVVLGGMGSITGSIVAAILLTVIREALRPLQEITQLDFRMILYSLFLIILMLTRPSGIMGRLEWKDYFLKYKKRKGQI